MRVRPDGHALVKKRRYFVRVTSFYIFLSRVNGWRLIQRTSGHSTYWGMTCWHLTTTHAWTLLLARLLACLFTRLTTAKYIQFVDEVNHEVGVDGIGPRVGALHCVDDT